MCAKLISVRYICQVFTADGSVSSPPRTNPYPFQETEKIKAKKVLCYDTDFFLVFSYPEVTVAVGVTNNFFCKVGVMNVSCIVQNTLDVFNKFFRYRYALKLISFTKIHISGIYKTENFIYIVKFTNFFITFSSCIASLTSPRCEYASLRS